jgi:ATP-dependent helicase/nuclease subunit A
VLTERYLATLDPANRASAFSAVAMTFTEKAARELRNRIRDRAHAELEGASDDTALHWRDVVRSLEAAPISTFHQFCVGLLRRHALLAKIDPDFEVLDATIASVLRADALGRCLRRQLTENDPDLVDLAVEYGMARVRDGLELLMDERGAGDLKEWVHRSEAQIVAIWQDVWNQKGRRVAWRALVETAHQCRQWFAAQSFENPKLRALGACMLGELISIDEQIDNIDWLLWIHEEAKIPRGISKDDWPSLMTNEQCKAVLESFRKAIKRWEKLDGWDESASLKAAGHSLQFVRLALQGRRVYEQAKRARGGLDFDDLLIMTRDLLRLDAGSIRDDPESPVTFLLVDEFQDTDSIQNEILSRMSGDALKTGGVFVVGDFKQSIYGFRGAQPSIFTGLRESFPSEGRLSLSENFRSVPAVLDFVNALFSQAFSTDYIPLRPGPNACPADIENSVEFVWTETEEAAARAGELAKKPDVDERRKAEARSLARLIRERIDLGWPVRDPVNGLVRNAHRGDIAFLFRAMTNASSYEAALAGEGLDYYVVGGASFYARQEILDVVNVLSVIEDANDSLALAGALRSPFFALSDNALYLLADGRQGDLAEGLSRCDEVDALSAVDGERALRARQLLDEWRGLKDQLPIAALVDRILDESGFEAALFGEFLGDRKRANARKLVRLARRFDARGGFTLAHFVAQLREDLRKPPREDEAATTDEAGESIRLMTIHQAKGLEFPIVVVPDLNRKTDQIRAGVAFHEDLGPLVRPGKASAGLDPDEDEVDSTDALGWKTYQILKKAQDDEESRRLFYVATTRARDVLILSAGNGPEAKPVSVAMQLLDQRFDRRTGACRHILPEGWGTPLVRVTIAPPLPRSAGTRERRRQPDLLEVANVITSATLEARKVKSAPRRPRFVDLLETPDQSPRAVRVQQLVRAILDDPRAVVEPLKLADAARRAGRRLEPPASSELIADTVRLLDPWFSGPLRAEYARSSQIERGYDWTLNWPPSSEQSTVFQGRAEFVVCEPSGARSVLIVSAPGTLEPMERLRLLLSARVVERETQEKVIHCRRVVLGDGDEGRMIEESNVSDKLIEELVSSWIASAT